KDAENQVCSRGLGDISNIAQVIRFFPESGDDDLSETFKVTKGQVYLPLLSPSASRRYGGIRDIWQRQNGCAGKVNSSGCDPSYSEDKQRQRQPFSSSEKIELT